MACIVRGDVLAFDERAIVLAAKSRRVILHQVPRVMVPATLEPASAIVTSFTVPAETGLSGGRPDRGHDPPRRRREQERPPDRVLQAQPPTESR